MDFTLSEAPGEDTRNFTLSTAAGEGTRDLRFSETPGNGTRYFRVSQAPGEGTMEFRFSQRPQGRARRISDLGRLQGRPRCILDLVRLSQAPGGGTGDFRFSEAPGEGTKDFGISACAGAKKGNQNTFCSRILRQAPCRTVSCHASRRQDRRIIKQRKICCRKLNKKYISGILQEPESHHCRVMLHDVTSGESKNMFFVLTGSSTQSISGILKKRESRYNVLNSIVV